MEYQLKGLRLSVFDERPLQEAIEERLAIKGIQSVTLERRSLDARKKSDVAYVYNLRFTVLQASQRLAKLEQQGKISIYEPAPEPLIEPRIDLPEQPIIVGFGPAGMFLGLALCHKGYRPIILERGEPVRERALSVQRLWEHGELNPQSNMQFGEGGAGTFSDGKLSTGKASHSDRLILETFVRAGAPDTILYESKPHIGTDYLRRVVVNIRQEILSLGGQILFGHQLEDLHLESDAIQGIQVSSQKVDTPCVVLAIGHSSRDTYEMLHRHGVAMTPKPFAIGTRIEHPAAFISESQYGQRAAAVLSAADYKLTQHHAGKGIFTFCMCPGGAVVCASSEHEGQVTNGMSHYARAEWASNSAIVVSIDPQEMGWASPMDGIAFQRQLEQRAYELGGGGYVAPAQRAADFLRDRPTLNPPETTYRPGVNSARLDLLFSSMIVEALKSGLKVFDRTMPGFIEHGVLIGLESRTSSPVRLERDENCESVSTAGLYLLGEGAGYAGGIMTCARDAMRFASLVRPLPGHAQEQPW